MYDKISKTRMSFQICVTDNLGIMKVPDIFFRSTTMPNLNCVAKVSASFIHPLGKLITVRDKTRTV